MKTRKLYLLAASALLALLPILSSCGSTRAYWGVENEYQYDAPGYHNPPPKHGKRHKPPKPPKPPKHHKHKHKNHGHWD